MIFLAITGDTMGLNNSTGQKLLLGAPTILNPALLLGHTHDDIGRWVNIQIQLADDTLSIYNIYGPNERSRPFFHSLLSLLHSDPSPHKVVGGDLDTVLNIDEDQRGGSGGRPLLRPKTTCQSEFLSMTGLVDIWRAYHPEGRAFTHYSNRPFLLVQN